jgi:cation diffusion facilitator CzcD-associated flavoprotein CzcO
VLPKEDPEFSEAARRRWARWPWLARLKRAGIYWANESRVLAFASHPGAMKVAERMARRHLRAQVPDPVLREKLTPDYTIGCKRILISGDYYPALQREDVDLETTAIERVEARAVVLADGRRVPVDTLVLATGFEVIGTYQHLEVLGAGGRDLGREWAKAPEAYLGTAVEGFPNLFTLVGPNTGLGHTSMLIMIEAQVGLVLQAIDERDRRGARSIEVDRRAQEEFNRRVQERSASAVWLTGCRSWYLDSSGVNRALWPWSTVTFRRRTARLEPEHYRFGA